MKKISGGDFTVISKTM